MFDMHRRRDDDQPTPSPNADLERQISVLTQAVHRLEDAVLDRQALDSGVRHTVLRDIDIPFGSMVMLAMKWMLAYFLASIFVLGLPLLVVLVLWLLGMGWRLGW
jgi:hypothetical protein